MYKVIVLHMKNINFLKCHQDEIFALTFFFSMSVKCSYRKVIERSFMSIFKNTNLFLKKEVCKLRLALKGQ